MLGSFYHHFGVILGSCWDHFGVILGSCWGHFGITLGSFFIWLWVHFGITLGSFLDHFGMIPQNILQIFPKTRFCSDWGSRGIRGLVILCQASSPWRWRKMLLKNFRNNYIIEKMLLWMLNGDRSHHPAAATATLFSKKNLKKHL